MRKARGTRTQAAKGLQLRPGARATGRLRGRLTGVERRGGRPWGGAQEGNADQPQATRNQGAPVTGDGFPRLRGVRWTKGRRRDSGSGQSLGPELPYLKRFSHFPWQRSPRLSNLALRKFYSSSNLNDHG